MEICNTLSVGMSNNPRFALQHLEADMATIASALGSFSQCSTWQYQMYYSDSGVTFADISWMVSL